VYAIEKKLTNCMKTKGPNSRMNAGVVTPVWVCYKVYGLVA